MCAGLSIRSLRFANKTNSREIMPNHVTNKVRAPRHVIEAILGEKGNVDFNRVISFTGEFPWDGISLDAEMMAEIVTGKGLHENPLIAMLQAGNRERASVKALSDESFEQFIQMLRNFRKCDVLHNMDFARREWGTKWNAYDCTVDAPAGTASFDTAWSCPRPVFEALSKKFPDAVIEISFADEDIGSNCGKFTLNGGVVVQSEIAPYFSKQSDEEKARWRAFAYEIKGWDPADDED